VSRNKKSLIYGQQELPPNHTHWMIKFASNSDPKDIGAIEYAYSLMAREAGLEVPQAYLFPAKKGAGYFGVARFDRQGEARWHLHTVSGLLHADHRLPSLDYEHIMRATLALTRNMQELEKILAIAAFNVLAHNRDDHAKNLSYLMDAKGQWTVAPAYDLTFSGGPGGEHSTTILGEGRNPGEEHLIRLAKKFDVPEKRSRQIIERVADAVQKWPRFAKAAGVSRDSQKLIAGVIVR
jgi:serine/threonine-protein kinase HipA